MQCVRKNGIVGVVLCIMLKDINNAANNMHNSYTGRATTAPDSVMNYQLPGLTVCVSLTCTALEPEQLDVKLFRFSTCSVHDSKSVYLHTKFLMRT